MGAFFSGQSTTIAGNILLTQYRRSGEKKFDIGTIDVFHTTELQGMRIRLSSPPDCPSSGGFASDSVSHPFDGRPVLTHPHHDKDMPDGV